MVNLPNPIQPVNTSEKLASVAGVSEKTYRMGVKVLQSDNEGIKKRVLSGETSISSEYKELTQKIKSKNEEKVNTNRELNNAANTKLLQTTNKPLGCVSELFA